MKQQNLFTTHWKHRYCHGGTLRKCRAGRGARPLSYKDPIHMVLKSNHRILRRPVTYTLIQSLIRRYSKKFFVNVEQVSVQGDHVHLLIRARRRSLFQSFFRVLSGQIAQRMTDTFQERWTETKIWKHRPFSRVVKGWRAYKIVRNYIQLNEKEAQRDISYQKRRLKGLTPEQIQSLWD